MFLKSKAGLIIFLIIIAGVIGYLAKWIYDDQKIINSTKEYLGEK